jgi:hypothetical protein
MKYFARQERDQIKKTIRIEFDRMQAENPKMKIGAIHATLAAKYNKSQDRIRQLERVTGRVRRNLRPKIVRQPIHWVDRMVELGKGMLTAEEFEEFYMKSSIGREIKRSICWRHLRNDEDRKDALQEAWFRIYLNQPAQPTSFYVKEAERAIKAFSENRRNVRKRERQIENALKLVPPLLCLLHVGESIIPKEHFAVPEVTSQALYVDS